MGRGGGVGRGVLLLCPIFIYCTLAYALMTLGAFALYQDHAVVNNACNTTYHFWKYGFLNMMLWLFATVSYCVWKGGGEGARARALVLTIQYFAFFTWGVLLWQRITETCTEVMDKQFHYMYLFHRISTVMNGITAFMFLFHEAYLGKIVGADLTVMADVQQWPGKNHALDRERPPGHSNMQAPGSLHPTQQPNSQPQLSPQLSYEYQKIMENNSSSVLPQTTP